MNTAGNMAKTKRMLRRVFETQMSGAAFSFVEILTMCPTGRFVETAEAPRYLADNLGTVHTGGVLKDVLAHESPPV